MTRRRHTPAAIARRTSARTAPVLALMALVGFAYAARADQFGLDRGTLAAFTQSEGAVTFTRDPGLTLFPDPRCPNTSTLRIGTSADAGNTVPLPCGSWSFAKNKFVYADASAAAGGVTSIVWKSVNLQVELGGPSFVPPTGPVDYVEFELAVGKDPDGVGPHKYCGRFTEAGINEPTALSFTGGLSCYADPTATPVPTPTPTPNLTTAFRINSAQLADPHAFLPNCGNDIAVVVNQLLTNAVSGNPPPPNGVYDLGFVVVFDSLDPQAGDAAVSVGVADCVLGDPSDCSGIPGNALQSGAYVNQASGTCLAPAGGTTGLNNSGSYPAAPATVASSTAGADGCWSTSVPNLVLTFSGITLPMGNVQIAAQYAGTPATGLSNGLLKGFVTTAAADNVPVPQLGAGVSLADLLDDNPGCATDGDDRDAGDTGWWFYVHFTAVPATWTGP